MPIAVDAAAKTVRYENGASLPFDLLAAVYPHCAPDVVRQSGLTDASGFVPVQPGSFGTSVPDVYAVGDVASIVLPNGKPHPKAGIFAQAQATALASRIKAEITGGAAVGVMLSPMIAEAFPDSVAALSAYFLETGDGATGLAVENPGFTAAWGVFYFLGMALVSLKPDLVTLKPPTAEELQKLRARVRIK